MSYFFLIAFVITLSCILLLIWPLLSRRYKNDGTKRLTNFISSLVITAFLAVGTWVVYFVTGSPLAIDHVSKTQEAKESIPSLDEMLEQLDTHLQSNETDLEGWLIKTRVDMARNDYQSAYNSIQRAYLLSQTEPYAESLSNKEKANIIARMVDTSVVLQEGVFNNEAHGLLEQSLNLDSENPQTLWLMAMSHSQRNNHSKAIELFTKAQTILAATGQAQPEVEELDKLIAREQGFINNDASDTSSDAEINNNTEQEKFAEQSQSVDINVSLSDKTQAQINNTDTVFILLRAINGPKAPLAVVKTSVQQLPQRLSLSQKDAMLASLSVDDFINQENIELVVRISQSGQPIKQDGDIEVVQSLTDWFADKNQVINIEL